MAPVETHRTEEDVTHRIDRDLLAFPPPWEAGSLATGWGLTKRELLAAMAMQGMLSDESEGDHREYEAANAAKRAVEFADALLKELSK